MVQMVKESAAQAGITIELKGTGPQHLPGQDREVTTTSTPGPSRSWTSRSRTWPSQYLPEGAINYSQVDDPELTGLIEQAQATVDPDSRRARLREAAAYVHDEMTTTSCTCRTSTVAHSDDWAGFVTKPSELLSIIDPESLSQVTPTK